MKSFFLSIFWLVLAVFFGLLQLWLLLLSQIVAPPSIISLNDILLGGTLLFFCSALVVSLSIDQFFTPARPYSPMLIGLLFALYPFVILIVTAYLFGLCFGKNPTQLDMHFIRSIQLAIFAMTGIYAIVVKTITFFARG